jgi:hypothetical protein
MASRWG